MSSALDMSLDEIIKNNKKSSGGGGGRSRSGSGGGPLRRGPNNRAGRRSAPYSTAKAPDSAWQHDKFSDQHAPAARPASIETGTKLYISNLDYGVSNEDIKELFAEIGDLKRYSIHYDRSGRSKGTAEVIFARRVDAVAAVKRYNNVQLDGKPMKIEIIEKVLPEPPKAGVRNTNNASKNVPGKGSSAGRPRGGASGRRGGRGRGKGRGESMSAEALDADLDKYYSEAKQT